MPCSKCKWETVIVARYWHTVRTGATTERLGISQQADGGAPIELAAAVGSGNTQLNTWISFDLFIISSFSISVSVQVLTWVLTRNLTLKQNKLMFHIHMPGATERGWWEWRGTESGSWFWVEATRAGRRGRSSGSGVSELWSTTLLLDTKHNNNTRNKANEQRSAWA